jgi:hypothetical protein
VDEALKRLFYAATLGAPIYDSSSSLKWQPVFRSLERRGLLNIITDPQQNKHYVDLPLVQLDALNSGPVGLGLMPS